MLNATNFSQQNIFYYGPGTFGQEIILGDFIYATKFFNNGTLYQLNASNISQVISNINYSGSSSSLIGVSDLIYISFNKSIYQLNSSNLSQIISQYYSGEDLRDLSYSNGYFYFSSNANKLYQVNASNITQVIAINNLATSSISWSIPVNNEYCYFSDGAGIAYQVNASNVSQLIAKTPLYGESSYGFSISDNYIYGVRYNSSTNEHGLVQLNAENISLENNVNDVVFSNLNDNSGTLIDAGVAEFNVTIQDSNGTVYLNIDNQNYSAINLGGNNYEVNLTLNPGDYNYHWISFNLIDEFFSSITNSYVFTSTPVVSGGSSSSSSGGSTGLVAESYDLGDLENIDSKVINLKYGGKISFDLKNIQYNISLKNINRVIDNVTLEILPIKKDVVLKPNESQDIDLNGDLVYDLNLGVGKISVDEVEVQLALKRKPIVRTDGEPIVKSVADTSGEIKQFESVASSIFGGILDLFNTNKFKCKKIGEHIWVNNLNFCVSSKIKPTVDNLKVLIFLKKSVPFGKSFVQIEKIQKYDCNGCFSINVLVNGKSKIYNIQDWKLVDNICVPITCISDGRRCGEISDGCGRTLTCGTCSWDYVCSKEGVCIPPVVSIGCSDSDSGKNYLVQGETKDRAGTQLDYCNGNTLVEGVCSGLKKTSVNYECPNGCKGGACLPEPWCTDDDAINDIFVFGTTTNTGGPYVFNDVCDLYKNNTVTQYYCRTDKEVIGSLSSDCTFDCVNGACVKGTCSDSDLNDSKIKGTVTDYFGKHEDYCSTALTLAEGTCGAVSQGSQYKKEFIYCPYGCQDGKCLESAPKCSDSDGLNFYNQGTINYLKIDGNIGQRSDTCTENTAYIGFSSGSGVYNFDFICPPNMANTYPYYGGKMYECPEGCVDGKCRAPKNETSFCDDYGYCKLYLGDYLVFDEYLVINVDYVYTNEGLAIGGDYNYSVPQKTKLLFSLGNNFNINSGELNEGNNFEYNFSNQGFFWMNISILNLFSNRDSNVVYDTVAKPYVEFYFDIPDYKTNTKKRKVTVRVDKTKPKPKSTVVYQKPTVLIKVKNFVLDVIDRGRSSVKSVNSKGKSSYREYIPPVSIH